MRITLIALIAAAATGLGPCQEGPVEPWRSALYPEDWTPAFEDPEGRFLHDFSYAGYRYGEEEPAAGADGVLDAAADFGADATASTDATAAIQEAIDAAVEAGGGVVHLPEGRYRCDGTLQIRGDGVVLRGEGPDKTFLRFTSAAGMARKSHIAFQGAVKQGDEHLLAEDGVNRSNAVFVADAAGLAPGDEVSLGWVITDAFIEEHGMTGTWKAFNGKWRPFFRRTVLEVNASTSPHTVVLDVPLRYSAKVRDGASLRKESGYLRECGVESLAVSNAVAWDAAWGEAGVHAIRFTGCSDCWARDIHSFDPGAEETNGYHLQNGGLKVLDCKRVTISDCRMERAQNRGGGGCGYLFEVSRSSEILFRDCHASAGRHNFIQNWDFGTSGCVWLRCISKGSRSLIGSFDPIGVPAYCEYHHSLAMANLVDSCTLHDGWYGGNRHDWSSGAGVTVTQSAYWNIGGSGRVRSWQSGRGYIIGTQDTTVSTGMQVRSAEHTAPEDYVEGLDAGKGLQPQSLYEDQLVRRLSSGSVSR